MKGIPLGSCSGLALCWAALLRVVCVLLLLAPAASALPIIDWDVLGSDGQTAAVLSTVQDVSGTALTPVNVTPWPGGFCCFTAAADWGTGAAAPDLTRYYEFSVTAAAGYEIVYEDITLSLFRGLQGTDHGAELWQLRASHDSYASAVASFDISWSGADEQILFSNVDISAVGTQLGTVTFRLYGYDYTSASDYSGLGNHPNTWPLSGTGANLTVGGAGGPRAPDPGPARPRSRDPRPHPAQPFRSLAPALVLDLRSAWVLAALARRACPQPRRPRPEERATGPFPRGVARKSTANPLKSIT